MSVKTKKTRREQGANQDVELWVTLCKTMAMLLTKLPEDDREDLTEVMLAMGHSEEEMSEGEDTIREMLSPKSGVIVPAIAPTGERNEKVAKWSNYAGGRVRDLRKKAGLTQDELAGKADLPQPHISRIENGEVSPTRYTLEKIANALGVSIAQFDPTP